MASDRSKLLLSLALNKEFRHKVDSVKSVNRAKRQKKEADVDYDYEADLNDNHSQTSKYLKFSKSRQMSTLPLYSDAQDHVDAADTTEEFIRNVVLQNVLDKVFSTLNSNSDIPKPEPKTVGDSSSTKKINILSDILLPKADEIPSTTQQETEVVHSNEDSSSCSTESTEIAETETYTKKGELRKRKKYEIGPLERKKQKKIRYINAHNVKSPCSCKKNCQQKVPTQRQKNINKQFWSLTDDQQKLFAASCIKKLEKKRQTVENDSRRTWSFKYTLKNQNGEDVEVCKRFLLSTLGYEPENDRILKNVRNTDPNLIAPMRDGRTQKQSVSRKIDRKDIVDHINSFRPTISHYRREHAPNRLYLPSDISITQMYKNFQENFPNNDFSYELYRKEVANLNISFTKLGHEECWECEAFKIHKDTTNHNDEDGTSNSDCEVCENWKKHNLKATSARQEYRKDAECGPSDESLFVSADLQKVIMLPRMEMFKEIIFTPRIIAFNESFVPLGKKNKSNPYAIIWHEAISGRAKDDIVSAYYAFFLANRDKKTIVIWLDNCSSQNKNWTVISFFLYIVNSSRVCVQNIEVKYFEPGHTFMSADAFHHQVELALKRKKKVYDFEDFGNVVQSSNSGRVNVIKMDLDNFYNFMDYTSKYKLQKLAPRVYLRDIVALSFKRGQKYFQYKTKFSESFQDISSILNQKYIKGPFTDPVVKTQCRGITSERKQNLVTVLKSHIPENRLRFWEELPVNDNVEKSIDD